MEETEYFKCKCGHDGFYISNHDNHDKRLLMCAKCAEVYNKSGERVEIEPVKNGEVVTFKTLKVKK